MTLTRSIHPGPVVEVNGLLKTYGPHRAVDEVSFSVQRGEIFGILGSNGAGKTTAVECAQGLRRPDAGSVRVLGRDPISEGQALRGRIGSQLQESQLPDRLKVREALRLFADDQAQAAVAMKDWELGALAGSAFADLSGGQQQRLFLALALMNKPEVVFLDELTQGLDPNARRGVWRLIERVREHGTTVVLVTHFMEEAEVLCDRVVVMTSGRVVDEGSPSALIDRHSGGVRVRFGAEADFDLAWIGAIPEVGRVERLGHEVEVAGSSPMIAHLGAGLVARNAVPDTIRVDQPDLEDALLSLITPTEVRI